MGLGVISYGTYVPFYRLERQRIAETLGGSTGKGSRSVASYDEDATTMAVEAARVALARIGATAVDGLYFATTNPPYLDKTNATAAHAALGLDSSALAVDMVGSVRSASGALRAAIDAAHFDRTTLVACADIRTGLPGSADERDGGDGAAALLLGQGERVIAEVVAFESVSHEFLDRWRTPGDPTSRVWEERFAEEVYRSAAQAAVTAATKQAGFEPTDIDHVVIAGPHTRAVRGAARAIGVDAAAVRPGLLDLIGNTGAAHAGMLLTSVLDCAAPGESILVLNLADGADAVVLVATEQLVAYRTRLLELEFGSATLAAQIDNGCPLPYANYLTWRGFLTREPPRRPDPDRPAAPPALRNTGWKFAFHGSRCGECGSRHLPPQITCFSCGAHSGMLPEPMAGVSATVSTFTIDRLAFSPSPPLTAVVIDFDGGGRYSCELTDVGNREVAIGMRVDMTFRRLYTAGGVHNYFWKARPTSVGKEHDR
jgi:hydroxymethylglutaryl-CoA synthase